MNPLSNRLDAFPLPEAEADAPLVACEGEAAVAERFDAYLSDESKMRGRADRLSLPRTESDLAGILRQAAAAGAPITLSGARTGITGGAVPQGGWLVSLERMNLMTGMRRDPHGGRFLVSCQPGVSLERLGKAIAAKAFEESEGWSRESRDALAAFRAGGRLFFPPDPTERSASLGGMAACNASGSRTFAYGPTRAYVTRLRMALADGSGLDLTRGEKRAGLGGAFLFAPVAGAPRQGRVPGYRMPQVKNAAGYYAEPGMDLLDLFIGSEGTLAVFTEIEVALVPVPAGILAEVAFFARESDAVGFVRSARAPADSGLGRSPLALEFFDANSLALLRLQKADQGSASPIPPALPDDARAAVYIELEADDSALEDAATRLMALTERFGSSPDTAWSATTEQELDGLKAFRHALPEAVNRRIGACAAKWPGVTKLGTDFAVPDVALEPMLAAYHASLEPAGLEYVIFGHIGNNHLHVNVLPSSLEQYERARAITLDLARQAVACGGTVSAEHGVGKLKKAFLQLMYGEAGVEAMRSVKRVFDPDRLLNRGNVF